MDNLVARGLRDHLTRFSLGALAAHRVFRDELPGADYCRAAAERKGRGSRRRLRRCRQPNSFWPSRRRDGALSGDHLVRGNVHDLRLGFGRSRRPFCRARWLDFAEVLEASSGSDQAGCACGYPRAHNSAARGSTIDNSVTAGSGHASQALSGGFRRSIPVQNWPLSRHHSCLARFSGRGYNE
jgi:hypothetical protein